MRILILHNRYKLHGGEDVVVQQESRMLRDAGHTVDVMEVFNDDIEGGLDKIKTAVFATYSPSSRDVVTERIRQIGAEVLHVHNFFPKLTPSVYDGAHAAKCAVVQTLHNYRLVCPGGLLFRDGSVCEECLGKSFAVPAIRHGCYRGSKMGAATIATMTAVHRLRGTWANGVERYIALNHYAKEIFAANAGIPENRIRVKPNVIPDSGIGAHTGTYALFVGRLSPEKGIGTLLRAAMSDRFPLKLKIAGTGPMEDEVKAAAASTSRIEFLGAQPRERVVELTGNALVTVVPSEWHEAGGPLVIGEAFSAGVPVVTTRMEPMATVVQEGVNGLLYEAGRPEDMCRALAQIVEQPEMVKKMRIAARVRYEEMYLPENNLAALLSIYQEARETLQSK